MNRLKEEQREEKRRLLGLPIYSASEEILSAVSHGIGVLLSIAALVLLLVSAPGDPIVIVSLSIYSATLILLYLVSTLYHALGVNKGKRVFRVLDHCSIFLLIAGTYTPLSLVIISRSFFADSSYMLSFSVLCSCVCSRLISPSVSSWHKQDNTLMHQSPGHIQRRTPYNF